MNRRQKEMRTDAAILISALLFATLIVWRGVWLWNALGVHPAA